MVAAALAGDGGRLSYSLQFAMLRDLDTRWVLFPKIFQRAEVKGMKPMSTYEDVQDYYGRQLQSSDDLKTSACCDISQVPEWLKPLLARIHPDVLSRYYGCGLICPDLLEGCRVLDLGCGTGRDVYALAQLVGPAGEVVGVDRRTTVGGAGTSGLSQ
jgi:SAM-dependent methyltransferase